MKEEPYYQGPCILSQTSTTLLVFRQHASMHLGCIIWMWGNVEVSPLHPPPSTHSIESNYLYCQIWSIVFLFYPKKVLRKITSFSYYFCWFFQYHHWTLPIIDGRFQAQSWRQASHFLPNGSISLISNWVIFLMVDIFFIFLGGSIKSHTQALDFLIPI